MDNDETFFFFFLFLPHNRDDTVAPTETIALSSSSSITPAFLRISRVRAECNRQSSARRTELKCPCFKSLWNSAAVHRVPFLQTDPGAVLSSLQACGVFEAAAHVFVPPPVVSCSSVAFGVCKYWHCSYSSCLSSLDWVSGVWHVLMFQGLRRAHTKLVMEEERKTRQKSMNAV